VIDSFKCLGLAVPRGAVDWCLSS